jgi:hypothetical protein
MRRTHPAKSRPFRYLHLGVMSYPAAAGGSGDEFVSEKTNLCDVFCN